MTESMTQAIARNRRKQALFRRAERVLNATHRRVFDYEDAGQTWKYDRMVANCSRILKPLWEAHKKSAKIRRKSG